MEDNLNKTTRTHLKARLTALEVLEEELKNENYSTISQVMGHIYNSIELQKRYNKEKGYE